MKKRYGLVREGFNNLNEPTETIITGNITLKEAKLLKWALELETRNFYRIEDNEKLADQRV